MSYIDLNCDMGEIPGDAGMDLDSTLMPYISSCNIACGFHAGDEQHMFHTVLQAKTNQVAIGAHPGFADRAGFGREEQTVTPAQVYQLMIYQMGALEGVVRAVKGRLNHVKPHGALYNMACKDRKLADAITMAVIDFDPSLYLIGLANSEMQVAAKAKGVGFVREGFADRRYRENGMLVPRNKENALISDPDEMTAQAIRMIQQDQIDTLCVHGDGPDALLFLETLHRAFANNQISIQPFGQPPSTPSSYE